MLGTIVRTAVLVCLTAQALAHMMIETPACLRSKSNPYYAGSALIDYSMTNPLKTDGSDFPCKKYQGDIASGISKATGTLTAGQNFTVTLSGSATHEGGSCQFSLSYDSGKTFGVIYSVIGGCPLVSSYTFLVPSNAPAGKDIILAWSWWNKIGNREMYMNCAHVNLVSSVTGSITLPRMFEANVQGDSTCRTIEGTEVNFANPQVTNCPNVITTATKVTLNGNGTPGNTTTTTTTSTTSSPGTTSTPGTGSCSGVAAWSSFSHYVEEFYLQFARLCL
ncbi:endoglucanase [Auriculariales sp. MPI-PUGE-AT-0066]|nr:endoglucanase [Auriculariales sp. MPI-PUGE-AT-0066]